MIYNICHKWWNNYYWYIKWEEKPIELRNLLHKWFHDRALYSKAHTRTNLWLTLSNWERVLYTGTISSDCEYHQWNDLTNWEDHKTYEEFMSWFLETFAKGLQK